MSGQVDGACRNDGRSILFIFSPRPRIQRWRNAGNKKQESGQELLLHDGSLGHGHSGEFSARGLLIVLSIGSVARRSAKLLP
jgi:hypothetical protein